MYKIDKQFIAYGENIHRFHKTKKRESTWLPETRRWGLQMIWSMNSSGLNY